MLRWSSCVPAGHGSRRMGYDCTCLPYTSWSAAAVGERLKGHEPVEQHSDEPNFERILDALRRRGVWIVLCIVLAGGAAYGLSKHQPKKYTATALLLFSNNQLSQQIAGLQTSVVGQAQLENEERLVRVGDIAEETASALGRGLTAATVSGSLSIAQQGETNLVGESSIVEVSSSYGDPKLAADIANTYAEKFVAEQRQESRRYLSAALRIVESQLAKLPARERTGTAREALETRAQSLRLLAGLRYGSVELSQRASVPTSPSSPTTSRNTFVGIVLGLLVGLGLAFLLERLDRRMRSPRDLEAVYHAPLLGLVPQSVALSQPEQRFHNVGAVPAPPEAETFGLILAHLRSFNAERNVRSVLITSATLGDGKTTIALHMAEAAARAGLRVLLLEMDFRTPTLAPRLAIASAPGLVDVLHDTLTLSGAIRSIDLGMPTDEEPDAVTLDVLTCGEERSSTPAKLIESAAMDAVWNQVQSDYDLAIVDTPALTSIPDTFAILRKVDGVVVVDRIGHSPRGAAEQLQNVLERSAVPLLGVIANRSGDSDARAPGIKPAVTASYQPKGERLTS